MEEGFFPDFCDEAKVQQTLWQRGRAKAIEFLFLPLGVKFEKKQALQVAESCPRAIHCYHVLAGINCQQFPEPRRSRRFWVFNQVFVSGVLVLVGHPPA
jgi:hypothetical protein